MKNMHEIASNTLIIGGLLMSAGALGDVASKRGRAEIARQSQVISALEDKYKLGTVCPPPVFGSGGGACFYDVPYAKTREEEDAVLKKFTDELARNRVPRVPRASKDGGVVSLGLMLAGIGGALRKIRE